MSRNGLAEFLLWYELLLIFGHDDLKGQGSHSLAGPRRERNTIYFFVKTIVTLGWALVLGAKRLFVL
jgi:hypothetical protein